MSDEVEYPPPIPEPRQAPEPPMAPPPEGAHMTDLDNDPSFGDSEPEDAWDPLDPVPVLLHNLVRRAALLTHERVEQGDNPAQLLDQLADLVRAARRRNLEGRELIRARDLDDDITFLRGRL